MIPEVSPSVAKTRRGRGKKKEKVTQWARSQTRMREIERTAGAGRVFILAFFCTLLKDLIAISVTASWIRRRRRKTTSVARQKTTTTKGTYTHTAEAANKAFE